MVISKEVIGTIINFCPEEITRKQVELDLGIVGDVRIIYAILPYQKRVIVVPGEPLTLDYTEQPVVALRRGEELTPLPYAADIVRLGEPFAVQVAEQLKRFKR